MKTKKHRIRYIVSVVNSLGIENAAVELEYNLEYLKKRLRQGAERVWRVKDEG